MKIIITLVIASLALLVSCEKVSVSEDIVAEIITAEESIKQNEEGITSPKSIVFIAGFDEDDNTYYANATAHFKQQKYHVIEGLRSLDEILKWLSTQQGLSYNEIHIVSHSNPWRGMSLQTKKEGERITDESLSAYLINNKKRTITGISKDTKIVFHSCGLGTNTALLKKLESAFSSQAKPIVIASPYFNVFGGKYAAHYLAKPYYVFYPTGQSKGPLALSQEIAATYPEKNINWQEALTTREEPALGKVYSYRFNIPVTWEIEFATAAEIPSLETPDAIMDFIAEDEAMATTLFKMNIPLEKYRWKVRVKGKVLKISGKTTALCVLKPVMNLTDAGNYATLDVLDKKIYTHL